MKVGMRFRTWTWHVHDAWIALRASLAGRLASPSQLLFLAVRQGRIDVQCPEPDPMPAWRAWLASWIAYGGWPGRECWHISKGRKGAE